jgi:hypothetical protein
MGYLDSIISSHNINPAYKTSCKQVLEAAVGGGWEAAELTALVLDDMVQKFEADRAGALSTGTIESYKSRFRQAVGWYTGTITPPWERPPAAADAFTVGSLLKALAAPFDDRPVSPSQMQQLSERVTQLVREVTGDNDKPR